MDVVSQNIPIFTHGLHKYVINIIRSAIGDACYGSLEEQITGVQA